MPSQMQGSGIGEATGYKAFLSQRRGELLARVRDACARAGRDAKDVTILAVSKTVDVGEVVLAHEAGYRTFGENRPQELKRKVGALRAMPELANADFHMIGNLQTNKVNQVLGNASLVHSVSSEHLAQAISTRSVARGLATRCLMEVNVSGEASKAGFSPAQAREAAERLCDLEGITLEGLMCMAPANDLDAARRAFCGLRELREELRGRTGRHLDVLSCGMSGDFEVAIEEGSTLVRLGRIVFDPGYADGTNIVRQG